MLALSDAALAHLALAATRIDPRHRQRWLQELAAKLDPPPRRRASTPAKGMPAQPRHGILPTKSTAAATPCPHFAALAAAPTPIAAARSNCSPPPAMARPRR
jgi:hypothetical protein